MLVSLRILQIDGIPEVRVFPIKGEGFQIYTITPQSLISIAAQALQAHTELMAKVHHAPDSDNR